MITRKNYLKNILERTWTNMGVYVITGGSGGIGGKTVEILKSQGHETINIDLKNGDINANIATQEGRRDVISKIHEMHPEGIDGLICVAGVAGTCGDMKLMFSLNYFGVTSLAYGLYELLKKKGGSCVVIVSNTISQGGVRMDLCDMLNYACNLERNEARILSILEQYDGKDMTLAQGLYATSKYALARWVRRISASWGANGVRINAVAPGNVRTPLTATMGDRATAALAGLPIPINYQTGDQLLDPTDIANVLAFLVSPAAHGVNGNIMFVDGGTDALLNSEKVY